MGLPPSESRPGRPCHVGACPPGLSRTLARLARAGWPVALLATLTLFAIPARADSLDERFRAAMEDYDRATQMRAESPDRARQLYLLSAQRLESIIAEGVVNGRLEYNLGNAYVQAGETGRAILHYRRAQLQIPRDPNLLYNLSVARKRCLTYIPPTRADHILRSVFFWHYAVPLRTSTLVAGVCYVAAFAFLAMFTLYRRRWMVWCAGLSLGLFLATGGSVAVHQYAQRHAPPGVILSSDVTVYRGPGTGYERLFEQPLQSGVEFTLREQRGTWWRIELADGKSGWVPAAAGERIIGVGSS